MKLCDNIEIKKELRDIIFCQELYKHIVGIVPDSSLTEKLKRSCLDLSLFTRIQESPLINGIPILLITDFTNITILNYKEPIWNLLLQNSLNNFYKNVYLIDIEDILVETANSTAIYFKKHKLLNYNNNDDNNERLYEFIQEYMDLREQLWDFNAALMQIYYIKREVLSHIIDNYLHGELGNLLKSDDCSIYLQLKYLKRVDPGKIIDIYKKKFIERSSDLMKTFISGCVNFNRISMFLKHADRSDPAIERFVQHEMDLINKESWAAGEFIKSIEASNPMRIGICSTHPFAFLENPLPIV